MISITYRGIIPRSVPEVFTTAADPERQLAWDPKTLKSVEKLTPGPLGPGSRYRGDFKGFGVTEYEFAEYEEGKKFTHYSLMKMGEMRHRFQFEAVPEGTSLTQTLEMRPKGMGRLMVPMVKVMMRKRLSTIVAEIDGYLGS